MVIWYKTTDSDILYLLKKYSYLGHKNKFYNEISSRDYDYTTLWKSYDAIKCFAKKNKLTPNDIHS